MNASTFNAFEELKKKSIKEIFGLLPRVYDLVFKSSPAYFLIASSLGLISAGVAALSLWLAKVVVDRVDATVGLQFDWMFVLAPVLLLIAIRIFESILQASESLISFMVNERVYNRAFSLLLNKASELDLAFFESPKFYDLLHQARSHLNYLYGVTQSSLALLRQLFSLTAMFGLLSVLHPLASLVLVVTTAPRVFYEFYAARSLFNLEMELTRNYRITGYFQRLMLHRENVKEVRVFGLGDYFIQKYLQFRELVIQALIKLNLFLLRVELLFSVLGIVGLSLVWLYAIYEAVNGNISLGSLFMVFGASENCRSAIQGLIRSGADVFEHGLYLTRFFELVDLDPRTVEGALDRDESRQLRKIERDDLGTIEFKNVSFRYPKTDELVLRDVSFVLKPKTRLAIVGENGAGKTTLIKLLTRLYDPIGGSVTQDGVDYKNIDPKEIHGKMTVVFQDFARYDIAASENISVGAVEHADDEYRIVQAAKLGGSHDTISKLPDQYATVLGRTFEEGVDLSGGEWQNVAISRAFMSDAKFFILDEPTAALDAFKEAELFDRFARLTKDKTVVFVSHRFSTVRMADQIIVIDEGRVVEQGTHEELVQLDGKYREMFDAQAERYR